jgi:putative toxin-antitoxin system antitoxin component (TIGR02293 family)
MKPYPIRSESEPDTMNLVSDSLAGVYANAFFDVAAESGFTGQKLASLFHTSLKTLQRYFKDKKRLDPAASEHILRLSHMYKQGKEVFGSITEFEQWLQVPAFGLNGHIPFKLLETPSGVALVADELTRIAFGDLS